MVRTVAISNHHHHHPQKGVDDEVRLCVCVWESEAFTFLGFFVLFVANPALQGWLYDMKRLVENTGYQDICH